MGHLLSFDVENWFDGNLHRAWTFHPNRQDPRLPAEMASLLDLLAAHGVRATFFVLGTVAVTYPGVVREIAAAGHEIACHAWDHQLLRDTSAAAYANGLRRCRALLQDLSGQPVLGHRAPSWSVDHRVPWAPAAILSAGFTYDSSIFPMRTPLYGEATAPTTPFWLLAPSGECLLELPPAVRRVGPLSIPFGGGLYWRILPVPLIRHLLQHADHPQVTYLHPWELNPAPIDLPPDLPLTARLALRHGVVTAQERLRTLLKTCSFRPLQAALTPWPTLDQLPTFRLAGDQHVAD